MYPLSLDRLNDLNQMNPLNVNHAKQTLMGMYELAWQNEINSIVKLMNYAQLKNNWKVANHVNSNLDKHKRSLVSQLKLGILPIEIETARCQHVPREQRICKLCKIELEDKMHFLFKCNTTENIRVKLYYKLPELLNYVTNIDKFKKLDEHPHLLGNYVNELWTTRNEILHM